MRRVPVGDQDAVLAFYVGVLGFEKRIDFIYADVGLRWVEVAPPGSANTVSPVPLGEGRAPGGDAAHCAFATTDIAADHAGLRVAGVDVDAEIARTGSRRAGLTPIEVSVGDPVPSQFFFRERRRQPLPDRGGLTVAKLIYSAITSLDGYVAAANGSFDWSAPDEEVHAFVNDVERPIGTLLLGRRMYEVLIAWETPERFVGENEVMRDYAAIWQAADTIVYSATLEAAASARTRIERVFAPGSVRALKASAARDLSIGGPTLAAEAIRAGLVDEIHLLLSPIVVLGGTRALPDDARWQLELVDERRFGSGVVHVAQRTS